MWAFRGVQYQGKAELAAMDVEALASTKVRFGFNKLFRCTGAKEYAAKKLTTREEDRLDEALSKLKASERRKDVLVCVFLLVLYGAQTSEPPLPSLHFHGRRERKIRSHLQGGDSGRDKLSSAVL